MYHMPNYFLQIEVTQGMQSCLLICKCVFTVKNYSITPEFLAILSLEPAAVIVLPNMFIYFIHTQHAIIMSLPLMYASSLTHIRGRVASAMCSKSVHDMSPG